MLRSDYIIPRPPSLNKRTFEYTLHSRRHILSRNIGRNTDTDILLDPFNYKFVGKSRVEQNL